MSIRRTLTAALAIVAAGCLSRPIEPADPRSTSTVSERLDQSAVDKIDLLLAIDNSISMADKQAVLALAVPDLVRGLLNPRCVDAAGAPAAEQPAGPLEGCPRGTAREFEPVLDVHIGIVSSSLGDPGTGAFCPDVIPKKPNDTCDPGDNTTANDHGRLISRVDPFSRDQVPTYQGKGFLAWDPAAKLDPPGEAVIEEGEAGLAPALEDMVVGVGQRGCGLESQLESWYRFLVDPQPYEHLEVVGGQVQKVGVDGALLAQRAAFLRPGSLVAILMLSDENDCSIKQRGDSHEVAAGAPMPAARAICATEPDDPCCKPCDEDPGECGHEASCFDEQGRVRTLDVSSTDRANMRCFDQKRRFGKDYLYPVQRYVNALTKERIDPSADTLEVREGEQGVENPLFADPGVAGPRRDPSRVFFAGIVGVPWQDVARDHTDLTRGFKSARELAEEDGSGRTGWDVILGDPARRIAPLDPLMHESIVARSGVNPVTGDALVTAEEPLGNAINGHERTISRSDDLQYACVFPLLGEPRDCTAPCAEQGGCECRDTPNDDPLCAVDAATGLPTRQARGKAYPGLRQLEVLKGLGDQGIVGSVCPAQLDDASRADFGYRPAIGAIIDQLKQAIAVQCLPRSLTPDEEGQVSCLIIEARAVGGEACTCDPAEARAPVRPEHESALDLPRREAAVTGRGCFCEVPQLAGEALAACQSDASQAPQLDGQPVDGWCYVDATSSPPLGERSLVEGCPVTERRLIRFVGKGRALGGATHYITCAGE